MSGTQPSDTRFRANGGFRPQFRKTVNQAIACLLALLSICALCSCGSTNGGAAAAALSLLAAGSGTPEIDDGQSITITATTSAAQGVTWSITSGPGTLSKQAATSVTFTAPTNADATTVVTATLVSDTSKTASITIKITAAPSITTTSLPDGAVGTEYSGQIVATEGAAPLMYSISAASLPAGLTLNGSTGAITGTPTGPANATPVTFTAKVTDSSTAGSGSTTKVLSITIGQAPSITSANSTTFIAGTTGSFTVQTTGVPTPSIAESGVLPSGLKFTDNGNGTGTLNGAPAAGTANNYAITFTASNGVGNNATQKFTLTVGQPPAITSANATTFTVGTAGSFSVTTTGFPTPALTESGALPNGVTFKDNGNGTASLSGSPAAGAGGVYRFTITASNNTGSSATQNFTLSVDQAPAITSANSITFTANTVGTFNVTTSGFPTPSIAESGSLPTGVTFVDNGNGTGTLSGTPTATGSYPITFTPSNGVGSPTTQNFTLTVGQAPSIGSVKSATFTVGTASSFTVTTTGFPAPALSISSGSLPSGVNFTDNGDGTATLSGTPAAGTGGTYAVSIKAQNGSGSTTQNFTLTVDQAPQITSVNNATFSIGGAGTFKVTTSGYPTPSIAESGALPSGVSFADNGNGTGTLSGTPASGTSGTYKITFAAANGVGGNASQAFTLTVDTSPAFTSANTTAFTVSTAGSFTVTTTGTPTPGIAESGTLPTGVTFADNGNSTGTLSGTPGAGTGGAYQIQFTASNGVGTNATQNFTLNVDQPPAITSVNNTTFTVGAAGSFAVTTSGFPAPTISDGGATLPSGVKFTDNGDGTGTLSGTPASGSNGTYNITFTASNAVGSNATQAFALTVNTAPAITSGGATTFTVGAAGSFTVTATGTPMPALSETGALPGGVAFKDNGNGTGTLSGTATAGSGGVYNITIKASSTSGNTLQNFTLTVDQAPGFTNANSTTFTIGSNGTFTISTTGFPKPSINETGALPSGVTFTDNGNGTGMLSGAPAAGSAPSYGITLEANNGVGTAATQAFTLNVTSLPISVSFVGGTFSIIPESGTTATITVQVTNDISSQGVSFSLADGSCSSSTLGTFGAPTVTANGSTTTVTIQYGSPAFPGTACDNPTLTATSVADNTKSTSFSFTIAGGLGSDCGFGSESLLTGHYTIVLRGNAPASAEGAVFDSDGKGHIAANVGVIDVNGGLWPFISDVDLGIGLDPTHSFVTVGPDHRGCMILWTKKGTGTPATSSPYSIAYRLSLGSVSSGIARSGHILQIGEEEEPGVAAGGNGLVGEIDAQDTTAFQNSSFNGPYAFGALGTNGQFAITGAFVANGSGGSTGGAADYNLSANTTNLIINSIIDGTQQSTFPATPLSFSAFTMSIANNGRGPWSFTLSDGSDYNTMAYVISASKVLVMRTDQQISDSSVVLFTGRILKQSKSSFTVSDLSGPFVGSTLGIAGVAPGGATGIQSQIFLATATGTGAFSSFTLYQNNGGTLTSGTESNVGSYSVGSFGRLLITGFAKNSNTVEYLVGPSSAKPNGSFNVDSSPHVNFGFVEPQTATSITSPSTFAFGTFDATQFDNSWVTGIETFDSGALTGTEDVMSANAGGFTGDVSIKYNYTIDAAGIGNVVNSPATSCSFSAGTCQQVFVVISSSRIAKMDATTTNATPTVTFDEQ